jgi:hypothetical protein
LVEAVRSGTTQLLSILDRNHISDITVRHRLMSLHASMIVRERERDIRAAYGNVEQTHPMLSALFASYCEKYADMIMRS